MTRDQRIAAADVVCESFGPDADLDTYGSAFNDYAARHARRFLRLLTTKASPA